MDDVTAIIVLLFLVAVSIFFFLPSLIAFQRGTRHRFIILIANVAIGATGIGWLAVLAFAIWPRGDALPVKLVAGTDDLNAAAPTSGGPAGGKSDGRPNRDRISRLSALAELRGAGVLSEEEFNEKKRLILNGE